MTDRDDRVTQKLALEFPPRPPKARYSGTLRVLSGDPSSGHSPGAVSLCPGGPQPLGACGARRGAQLVPSGSPERVMKQRHRGDADLREKFASLLDIMMFLFLC